jgi:HlyD family secretion protein
VTVNVKKVRIGVLLVALLGYGGYLLYTDWNGEASERDLRLYGNVDIREVQLGFRVAGRLQEMYFEEGDAIAAGDPLATLDDEPMTEALAVAQARVLEAQAGLDRANTGSRPQEIQGAEARVDEARSALDNANQELRRQKELTEKNLSSQRLLDSAVATRDQAAARLNANREGLALAVEGFRQEDIAAARAALAAALALKEEAETRYQDTRLYAPSAGVILTRVREPGSMLAVGAPVYTLSLTETVYVRAYVDEPHLGEVAPGAQVIIRTDSSDREYQGQVGFISPRAEFTPKTVETPALRTDLVYRLRIVVPDADDGLRQGMPVTVEFPGA